MKNTIFITLFISFLLSSCSIAQMGYSTTNKRAIKYYEKARTAPRKNADERTGQPNFKEGIELLKKALDKDENFLEAHQLIGEFYRLTGQNKKAVHHYKTALKIRPSDNLNGRLYLDIGNLQMQNLEFEDAIDYFDMILQNPKPSYSPKLLALTEHSKKIAAFNIEARKNPLSIDPINIGSGINTQFPEYFPTLTVDGKTMLFTREIPDDRPGPRGQEDFFIAHVDQNNIWKKAIPMPANINTNQNEGAPTLSADGRTLIFVGCADRSGSFGNNRIGKGSCDLFITHKIGNRWTDPINLPGEVNTWTWETQPSLSSDGKTLYFVRKVGERGKRHSDIFVSTKNEDDTWSKAKPLSNHINTPAMESSVFIHPDGQTLYFTSNGHIGLGGLDIFMSRKDPLGNWSEPINLGYPINTENNENSLMVGPNGKIAFFASDRPGGRGDLDIYYFELPESIRPIQTTYFTGIVFDAITKEPLEGKFELINLATGETVVESSADPISGEFLLALPTGKDYALHVNYPGYSFFSKNFNMKKGEGEAVHMDVPMIPITDNKAIRLANVFFDLDKASLRDASSVELNKLVDFLKNNQTIHIEIEGHTDSRGADDYNLELSENRAKAVYDYLTNKGINASRLSYKGYGETQPIVTEEEIAALSTEKEQEEAYQRNRRVAYRIINK